MYFSGVEGKPSLGTPTHHIACALIDLLATSIVAPAWLEFHFANLLLCCRTTRIRMLFHRALCTMLHSPVPFFLSLLFSPFPSLFIYIYICVCVQFEANPSIFDSPHGNGINTSKDVLSAEAAKLKCLAENFKIPILVSNQVTTDISGGGTNGGLGGNGGGGLGNAAAGDGGGGGGGGGSFVKAALGNTWAHSVNIRIILEYVSLHA